jgi:circadian clock protein KaiB
MRRFHGANEAAMSSRRRRILFRFRLYVADHTPNSALAMANFTALCRTYLPNRHEIEVVDVFRKPERALADAVFLTPTLVRLAPAPVRRVVGTLSQTQLTLHALGLEALDA